MLLTISNRSGTPNVLEYPPPFISLYDVDVGSNHSKRTKTYLIPTTAILVKGTGHFTKGITHQSLMHKQSLNLRPEDFIGRDYSLGFESNLRGYLCYPLPLFIELYLIKALW